MGVARCTLCVCDFSVASGRRKDVRRPVETARLQKMSKTTVATRGGTGQYVVRDSNAIDGVTKAETMVATKGGVGQYVARDSNAIDGVTKAETMMAHWLAPQPPTVSRRRV